MKCSVTVSAVLLVRSGPLAALGLLLGAGCGLRAALGLEDLVRYQVLRVRLQGHGRNTKSLHRCTNIRLNKCVRSIEGGSGLAGGSGLLRSSPFFLFLRIFVL